MRSVFTGRRVAVGISVALSLLTLSLFGAGEALSLPARGVIGDPPSDLPTESVTLQTAPNETVAGWVVRGKPGTGAVLLLHGVRGDRREMIDRARFLHRLGYTVLLIDLPAHGESTGARITYGMREAEGVTAALHYLLHQFPAEKIGVIGVSLGAASIVLSKPNPAPSAVVLESMFPTIREAVADRLDVYLGPFGWLITPALLMQLPLRLGISPEQLRPINDIALLHAPVLIVSGSTDRRTTLDETRRIFGAANEPKELWVVEGAAHVDLHAFEPKEYESRVAAFLEKYLESGAAARINTN